MFSGRPAARSASRSSRRRASRVSTDDRPERGRGGDLPALLHEGRERQPPGPRSGVAPSGGCLRQRRRGAAGGGGGRRRRGRRAGAAVTSPLRTSPAGPLPATAAEVDAAQRGGAAGERRGATVGPVGRERPSDGRRGPQRRPRRAAPAAPSSGSGAAAAAGSSSTAVPGLAGGRRRRGRAPGSRHGRRAGGDHAEDAADRDRGAGVGADLDEPPGRPGAGTSTSTLSVVTSTSGSSRATMSPTSLSQRRDRALGDRLAHRGQGDLDRSRPGGSSPGGVAGRRRCPRAAAPFPAVPGRGGGSAATGSTRPARARRRRPAAPRGRGRAGGDLTDHRPDRGGGARLDEDPGAPRSPGRAPRRPPCRWSPRRGPRPR